MATTWTIEQVLALAPDSASAKNGKSLATLSKWRSLGQDNQVVWGECQGSGKDPYRTQIDLSEPAFRCSCPSRKFPCKHGLGLFLLLVSESASVSDNTPPDWVTEWLASRAKREEKQKQKLSQTEQVTDTAAQAKRTAARLNKVQAGVQDLQLWLQDLARQGLTSVNVNSYQFWEQPATRMIDAQAPGLARHLRDMAGTASLGAGWEERLLLQLGKLQLILEGWQRLETLPPGVQADIQTQIGWGQSQGDLLASEQQEQKEAIALVQDTWLVMGQQIEEEEKLRVNRMWLWGKEHNRSALLLQFAHGQQPFEINLMPGTLLNAELVFFESAYPLRAIIKHRQDSILLGMEDMPGYANIDAAIAAYSQALSLNPWLDRFPVAIQEVIPIQTDDKWFICDRNSNFLPISSRFEQGWLLLALSGGHPITVFGEWSGIYFSPLSTWAEQKFYNFSH